MPPTRCVRRRGSVRTWFVLSVSRRSEKPQRWRRSPALFFSWPLATTDQRGGTGRRRLLRLRLERSRESARALRPVRSSTRPTLNRRARECREAEETTDEITYSVASAEHGREARLHRNDVCRTHLETLVNQNWIKRFTGAGSESATPIPLATGAAASGATPESDGSKKTRSGPRVDKNLFSGLG